MSAFVNRNDRRYFTLVSLASKEDRGQWAIEFGDYARDVVKQELADMKEHDRLTCKRGARPVYRILAHKASEQRQTVEALNTIEGRRPTWMVLGFASHADFLDGIRR